MSSQEDNPNNPPTTPTTVDTSDQDFNEILNLITAMHTPVPSSSRPFWNHHRPSRGQRSYVFDPRRLTFGETIEDDSETDENAVAEASTDVEHPLPELVIQGVAAMPQPPTTPPSPNEEEKVSDETLTCSDSDSDANTKECCVCYKTKSDLHTLVLPTCGHIICQN